MHWAHIFFFKTVCVRMLTLLKKLPATTTRTRTWNPSVCVSVGVRVFVRVSSIKTIITSMFCYATVNCDGGLLHQEPQKLSYAHKDRLSLIARCIISDPAPHSIALACLVSNWRCATSTCPGSQRRSPSSLTLRFLP